jgi:hypothetical protein
MGDVHLMTTCKNTKCEVLGMIDGFLAEHLASMLEVWSSVIVLYTDLVLEKDNMQIYNSYKSLLDLLPDIEAAKVATR